MLDMWWPRRRRASALSAFADGELTGAAADRVAERLVFDAAERQKLDHLRRVDNIAAAALTFSPAPEPDAEASADAVLAQLTKVPTSAPVASRNWTPTVVASVGLLVTAGVAVAGLKRRGWV